VGFLRNSQLGVRHSLNANYVWQLPVKTVPHGRGPDYLVKERQVSGTIFARTGFPYMVIDLAERVTWLGKISMEQSTRCQSSHSAGRIPAEQEQWLHPSRILVGRRKW